MPWGVTAEDVDVADFDVVVGFLDVVIALELVVLILLVEMLELIFLEVLLVLREEAVDGFEVTLGRTEVEGRLLAVVFLLVVGDTIVTVGVTVFV